MLAGALNKNRGFKVPSLSALQHVLDVWYLVSRSPACVILVLPSVVTLSSQIMDNVCSLRLCTVFSTGEGYETACA